MSGLYSTDVLVAVVANLKRPETFFIRNFFPTLITEESEEIHFDIAPDRRRLAPFVSPLVEGRLVESQGFSTRSFRPAYVKDKRVLDANRPLKRIRGEQIAGRLSPAQRQEALLVQELEDGMWMLWRRKEVMATEALRTGKITVTGEGFPTVVVDFQRDAALTKALLTTARWGEVGVSPVDNLEDWAEEILEKSGAAPTDAIFERNAYRKLKEDPKFEKTVDLRRGGDSFAQYGPMVTKEVMYMGQAGSLRLWMYQDWYEDPATAATTQLMPKWQVVLTSQFLEGRQQHGAIRDEDAGFQAVEFWPKSWTEPDPSARILLMQSAPLPVPFRPDASMGVLVRDD